MCGQWGVRHMQVHSCHLVKSIAWQILRPFISEVYSFGDNFLHFALEPDLILHPVPKWFTLVAHGVQNWPQARSEVQNL